MKQQTLPITCTYSESGDIIQILHRSFSLYLHRALADAEEPPLHRHDEYPLPAGGQ